MFGAQRSGRRKSAHTDVVLFGQFLPEQALDGLFLVRREILCMANHLLPLDGLRFYYARFIRGLTGR